MYQASKGMDSVVLMCTNIFCVIELLKVQQDSKAFGNPSFDNYLCRNNDGVKGN